MSYCRFSTDDFQCDLYCYENVHGGFTTHVAGKKRVFRDELPEPVQFDVEHIDAWLARHQRVMEMVKESDLVALGLEHDGATFWDATQEDFLSRLISLKESGYRFPGSVLDTVRQEIAVDRSR